MNDFKYSISLLNYNVADSAEYAKYTSSLYKEGADYTLHISNVTFRPHNILKNYPEELHRLMIAQGISFKNSEDCIAFKLRFAV